MKRFYTKRAKLGQVLKNAIKQDTTVSGLRDSPRSVPQSYSPCTFLLACKKNFLIYIFKYECSYYYCICYTLNMKNKDNMVQPPISQQACLLKWPLTISIKKSR